MRKPCSTDRMGASTVLLYNHILQSLLPFFYLFPFGLYLLRCGCFFFCCFFLLFLCHGVGERGFLINLSCCWGGRTVTKGGKPRCLPLLVVTCSIAQCILLVYMVKNLMKIIRNVIPIYIDNYHNVIIIFFFKLREGLGCELFFKGREWRILTKQQNILQIWGRSLEPIMRCNG